MRNKGAICIHEHDSKRKIYVVLFDFWGFTLRPPLGLCHWSYWELPSLQTLQFGPSHNLWLLAKTLTDSLQQWLLKNYTNQKRHHTLLVQTWILIQEIQVTNATKKMLALAFYSLYNVYNYAKKWKHCRDIQKHRTYVTAMSIFSTDVVHESTMSVRVNRTVKWRRQFFTHNTVICHIWIYFFVTVTYTCLLISKTPSACGLKVWLIPTRCEITFLNLRTVTFRQLRPKSYIR